MTIHQLCEQAKLFVLPMNLLTVILLAASYGALRRLYQPASPAHSAFLRNGAIAWATNTVYVIAEIVASHPIFAGVVYELGKPALLSFALLFSTLSSAYLLYAGLEYRHPKWRHHRIAVAATFAYVAWAFVPLISAYYQWHWDRVALGVVVANCVSIWLFSAAFRNVLDSKTTSKRLALLVQIPLLLYGLLQLLYGFRFTALDQDYISILDAVGFAIGTSLKAVHLVGIALVTVSRARALQNLEQEDAERQYQKRVISEMVHELNTPALALKLQLDQLQAATLHRGNVKEETRRTEDLITIFLAIVHGAFDLVGPSTDRKVDDGREREPANVNTLLQAAVMSVKLALVGRRADGFMSFVTYYSHQPEVVCDRVKLKQVFINLIKNAYDAAPPGGGTIWISTSKRPDPTRKGKYVCITITDDGEGITERNAKRVFDHGFTTRLGNGRGHGLAIVKQIVDEHHGAISLKSPARNGRGTAFEILLPAADTTVGSMTQQVAAAINAKAG